MSNKNITNSMSPGSGNNIVIWLLVAGLFFVLLFTSADYSKPYWNLEKFGISQLVLVVIITFLLLYRSISRLKVGDLFEVEMLDDLTTGLEGSLESNREMSMANSELADAIQKLIEELRSEKKGLFQSVMPGIDETINPKLGNVRTKLESASQQMNKSNEALKRVRRKLNAL